MASPKRGKGRPGGQTGATEGRTQVLEHLRKGPASVNDLAGVMDVTPNAVRAQLTTLGAEGLVEAHGKRPGSRRPEVLYRLTVEGEEIFPKAYTLLLEQTLDTLRTALDPEEYERMVERIGRDLAERLMDGTVDRDPLSPTEAVDVLVKLGGVGVLEDIGGDMVFRGTGCPLSRVAPHQPDVCRIAAALLSELTGRPVSEECERSDRARCVFRFASDASPYFQKN